MTLKEGDVVRLNYTGRTQNGEVFETTLEKIAVKEGIFDAKRHYEPLITVIGSNDLLQGLDNVIREMKEKENKKVTLKSSEAFGERNPEHVRMVSLAEFKQRKINPFPGLIVDLNGAQGRVQTVSGGRVRVDFNHPLAGADVEFEVDLEKILKTSKEKIEALSERYFTLLTEKPTVKTEKDKVTVKLRFLPIPEINQAKHLFARQIIKAIKEVKSVEFIEEYKRPEKKEKSEKKDSKSKKETKK